MTDEILVDVATLKNTKQTKTTEATLSCINELIQKKFMFNTSVFVADSIFLEFGCVDRTEVYNELSRKGYEVTEIQPCRGECGGIVISGW